MSSIKRKSSCKDEQHFVLELEVEISLETIVNSEAFVLMMIHVSFQIGN